MKSTITFHGGAGTVTGANFLLDTRSTSSGQAGKKILIDCGILQQENVCGEENLAAFPYDPTAIDVLAVTHAHADHIGRIPKLVRDGFRGRIYSTPATKDLAALMFDDAARVMADQAARLGCDILYTKEDIDQALALWDTYKYHNPFAVGDIQAEFFDAGHILGSACVRFSRGGKSIVFSGDLGNSPEPLLQNTEMPTGADYLVIESVYGDRVHESRDGRRDALRAAVEETQESGGTLLIPSFSIERTQVVLSEINDMVEGGTLQPVSVFLDSPLAIRITDVFRRHKELFNDRAKARFDKGDDPFAFPGLTVTMSTQESKTIRDADGPKVIIAGAGMSEGGRIRSHQKDHLPHKRDTILFVGYQAPGSLGRRIQDGAKEVRIDGEHVRVHAAARALTGYSGHADRDQLLSYVEGAGESLKRVFVTMGEPRASIFLAQRIRDFLGVEALVPEKGSNIEIDV